MRHMELQMVIDENGRHPDIPEDVDFRMIKDNGDTAIVEILSDSWPPRINKADIWRRATNEEAEILDSLLQDPPQPNIPNAPGQGLNKIRMKRIWIDSPYVEYFTELYDFIYAIAIEEFDEERVNELLAPSE